MTFASSPAPLVLLTRSEEDNRRIAPSFEKYGLRVRSVPLIAIDPLPFKSEVLGKGGEPPFVLLTSKVAADRWFAILPTLSPPLHVRAYLTVGDRSAEAVQAFDPSTPIALSADSGAGLLETLMVLEQEGLEEGATIIYPCSARRRDEVVDNLHAIGFDVRDVPLYEPRVPEEGGARLVEAFSIDEPITVAFFSPSAVDHYFALLNDVRIDPLEREAGIVYGAIGETTAEALRRRGVERILVPPRPAPELLARMIARDVKIEPKR